MGVGTMNQSNLTSQFGRSGAALLHDYWDMAVRRKWIFIAAVLLSLSAALVYCKMAKKVYRSDTLILIDEQKIPENFVQGIAEGPTNFERRIFVIETQVRNRERLDRIRKDLNLFPEEEKQFGVEAVIAKMNSSIEVAAVTKGTVPGQNTIGAFTIAFSHEDPAIAMKVTAQLASMLINEDLKDRTQAAEGTTEFLDNEVARTKLQLDKKEEEITQFKSRHIGFLPQQIEANLRALDRLHFDLNAVQENLQRQTDRLALVENAIQQYLQYGIVVPALVNGPVQPNPSFARLNELKDKLTKLEAEFWEGYPEVALTKDEISQLEQKLRHQYRPNSKGDEQTKDPYYQDLRKQKSELTSELALLSQRQRMLRSEKSTYEGRVETSPAVEQQLLTLMRDYENLKGSYHSLVEKRLHALVAENLEKRQKGAQLKVLEKASFPRVPERPNQPRVIILGLIFGSALGMALTVVLEQLNPQFRRPEDVEVLFGPQLLAAIPDFSLEYAYKNWRRFLPRYQFRGDDGQPAVNGAVSLFEHDGANGAGTRGQGLQRSFVTRWLPNAIVSEQYRVAATRLSLAGSKEQSTVIAVTSAVKGEGKTTTVINLGYTMARDLGKRVLLIDCDFKCPGLDQFTDYPMDFGLGDYLTQEIDIEACMTGFGDVPCWIMPVGKSVVNPTQLLKTERMALLLDSFRNRFDYVILNTPPILPQATMNILAGHADLLLLVVRANSTPHDVVKRAVNSLRSAKPLHVILNAVGTQTLPSYVYEYKELQAPRSRAV